MSQWRTRVKICGLTRSEDVQAAVAAGVDAIGLVFYPPSPRAVSIDQAQQLMGHIPPYVQVVGLFVDASVEWVQTITAAVPLDVLQFHGNETPQQCADLAGLTGRRWYKALQVRPDQPIHDTLASYRAAGASALLLDAWHPDLKGGTGQTFDWQMFPRDTQPLILAGGLTPDNIALAITQTRPYAVDVSGGVESSKGRKDADLIQKFMQGVANVHTTIR